MVLTALMIMAANLNLSCLVPPIPNMADIVIETVDYRGKISDRIDFVGMQRPLVSYHWPGGQLFDNEIDGDRNVLSLFISKLDVELWKKIHVTQSYDSRTGSFSRTCLFPWRVGKYNQFLLGYQEPVNDSLSCSSSLFGNYKAGNNKMVSITLSQIKKYSTANYFLLIAIKPIERNMHKSKKMTVALLTIIYNRDGKKIYSKIYEETLDIVPPAPTLFPKEFPFYDCTMKLIENQGEQISKDLEFLLTADDASSPTLEDLHKRLQQPGTIDGDIEYLKGLQRKDKW